MKISIQLSVLAAAVFAIGCNKDDDQTYPVTPNLLTTPATLENNSELLIPDGTGAGCGSAITGHSVENTIVIENGGTIIDPSKISVELRMEHSWASDLVIELIAPDGQSATLIKRLGSTTDPSCGNGPNFGAGETYTFGSAFQNQIDVTGLVTADLVAGGNFAPSSGASQFPETAAMTSLQTFFTGKSIKGTWKLRVTDYGAGDTGRIITWKLKLEAGSIL